MKDSFRFIPILALLICLSGMSWGIGTTGVLSGKVVDKETNNPVENVFVAVRGASIIYQAATDEHGFFSIAGVLGGSYEVSTERIGYEKATLSNVIVTPDSTSSLLVEIVSSPTRVPGITVKGARASVLSPRQTFANYGYSDQEVREIFPGPASLNIRQISESFPGILVGYDNYYGIATPHIRGGTGFDIGYAFDGVPMYSNITYSENAINSIGTNFTNVGTGRTDVFVGGYPVQYGNFISGFVNQVAKRGFGLTHGSIEYQYGVWLDQGRRLPSYDPLTGNLAGYNGNAAYNPNNISLEIGGSDKRFSYYFSQIIQDGGVVPYSSVVDIKPLVFESAGILNSTQERDTVLNLNYDLDKSNGLQLLFYEGISKSNYAGFGELPCNFNITFGCVGTSNPGGAGFGETYNANNISPLSDTHDNSFFDLEKFEWSHRFEKPGSLLSFRLWRYNPGFYINHFDAPLFTTLWEFERSSNQGGLLEYEDQLTPENLFDVGASFVYSRNYFQSSQFDFGTHYNSAQQIAFGLGPGQNPFVGVADIIRVPDTQTWGAWISDEWRPSPRWVIDAGIRWDLQNTLKITGGGIVTDTNGLPFVSPVFCQNQGLCLDPDRFHPSQISPRLGAAYQLSDNLSLKATYGKFVTFAPSRRVEAVRYSSSFPFSSVFLPGFPGGTPAAFQLLGSKSQSGENLDLSWEYKLDKDAFVKLTSYVKHMKDPLQIAVVGGFPYTTNAGTISSKGIELFLKTSDWHGLSGWLSYTLSSTKGSQLPFQTDLSASVMDPVQGFTMAQVISDAAQLVPTAYDQRHMLSANMAYKLGKWDLAPSFMYGSGYPFGIGRNQLMALAALMDSQSFLYGGPNSVQQSANNVPGFNPLGEAGFNGLRMPAWWLGNLAVAYHTTDRSSIILNIFNVLNSNKIINVDNAVLSGIGYPELTNPNAFSCCYTSNDTTQNILPQYNPMLGKYAPIAYPKLRQFYFTVQYEF